MSDRRIISRIARVLTSTQRQLESLQRVRQMPHTSVVLDDGTHQSITESAVDARDAVTAAGRHEGQLGDVGDALDDTTIGQAATVERTTGEASADAAFELALHTREKVTEARDAADAAMDAAARSERTALGLRRVHSATTPEPPEGGWMVGAEWVVLSPEGVARRVMVWDGEDWVHAQYLADEILFPGEDGAIRIGNGMITAPMMAADFFDALHIRSVLVEGGRIVGAEMELTASDAWSMIYDPGNVVAGTLPDFTGGSPAAVVPATLASGRAQVTAPAGKIVAYWANTSRVPVDSAAPRRVRVTLHTTQPVTGLHLVCGSQTVAVPALIAGETRAVQIEIAAGIPLAWLHVGGTVAAQTTLSIHKVQVESGELAGAKLTIRNVDGVPGLRVHRADGSEALSVTPQGVRAPNLPYAMAAGTITVPHAANVPAYAGIVVTLPTGKFTRPPIPDASMFTGVGGSQKDVARAYQSTETTIVIGVWTGDNIGTSIAHTDVISWRAFQMTEGSAAG